MSQERQTAISLYHTIMTPGLTVSEMCDQFNTLAKHLMDHFPPRDDESDYKAAASYLKGDDKAEIETKVLAGDESIIPAVFSLALVRKCILEPEHGREVTRLREYVKFIKAHARHLTY